MSAAAPASATSVAPVLTDAEVRLPVWFVPRHYDVALVPDLRSFVFQASVRIDAAITRSTRHIELHSLDCSFPPETDATRGIVGQPRVRLMAASGAAAGSLQALSATLDAKTERVRFDFAADIVPGEYTLDIVYAGVLNDQLAGFYRSSYKGADGSAKFLACTQFEATDARRALPCVDEPAAKATFDVELFVDPALQAVSNMPVLSKTTTQASENDAATVHRGLVYPAGLARHRYYTSPIMSTYLLAFVVGEFDYISRVTSSGVEVRVYTGLGKTHLGEFSLSTACKALEFYNEYFGIKYPLMKMDLLAIPDFAAGAMENWGCITYRETALLIDAEHSSAAVMQRVARTVCHEIAHMWFGNLVTMSWWSYLWLNEGFARFLEFKAVDHIYPQWSMWQSFVAEVFAQAQNLDALESSHPVEVTVHHPSEVNEIFDTISYAKGASLIRMLHAAIGEIAFQKGLQSYLRKFSFQNTTTEDLWASFAESSGTDVAAMMDCWVKRIGYPVLTASERPGKHLCLCQERFLATYDPAAGDQSKLHETTWVVPVQVASWKRADLAAGKNDEPHIMKALFNKPEAEFPAWGLEAESVLKVNPGQSGFYRVCYSPALFQSLADSIPMLPPVERLGVLRDTFALGSSGRTSITQSLELLRHFGGESNYAVMSALAGNLAALASLHAEQPYFPHIQALVREVFAQSFARLGWESNAACAADGQKSAAEQQQDMLFRALVISMLGPVAGSPDVVAEALRRFRAFVAAPLANPIPADLRGSVYSLVAKKGSAEDYAQLRRMFLESELQEEKNRLLGVLGMVDSAVPSGAAADAVAKLAADLARIRSVLDLVLAADSPVRPGNLGTLMLGVGSSALGRQEAWAWFQTNFEAISERYSKGQNFIISGILNGMLGGGSSVEWVAAFEAFFAAHPIPQAARTIKQLSEAITTKANRLAREAKEVEAWLADKKY